MKISIGSKIIEGPWGGGNLFAINLSNYLAEKSNDVIYDLSEPDIDLILLTDPRSRSESSSTFNHIDILKYKKYVNPNVSVVQRINECDERKNTSNINDFYLEASQVADHVVFVSKWLQDIYINKGMDKDKTSVILAGANPDIFTFSINDFEEEHTNLKIVTHHWSSHFNKGFKIYKLIDELIDTERFKDKIEFTYVGNYQEEYNLKNTKIVKPLFGKELANELKKHDIYVTGSLNEPSGNHHIEASQSGLPVMYINSGGIPEYCEGFGVEFDEINFEERLIYLKNNLLEYRKNLENYPFNSDKMSSEFYALFKSLINSRQKSKVEKISLIGYFYLKKNKYSNKFRMFSNIKSKVSSIFKLRFKNEYQ